MNSTLQFYEDNAEDFVSRTIAADMSDQRNRFLAYVKPHGHILDLGCGSGRDSRAFLDLGYNVEAVDGCKTLCETASKLTGITVRHLLFESLDYVNQFDAVWACASLLHIPSSSIASILCKIRMSLKEQGLVYISVKQGTFEGQRDGRYFTDYTENELHTLLSNCNFNIIDAWTSIDVRSDRNDNFLNVICSKQPM